MEQDFVGQIRFGDAHNQFQPRRIELGEGHKRLENTESQNPIFMARDGQQGFEFWAVAPHKDSVLGHPIR